MNKIDYENEALKLKSLITMIAGFNPENTAAIYELMEVAKMAQDIAENIYCVFANGGVKICE